MTAPAPDARFYPTPLAFTRWLFMQVPILGVCVEPCAGAGDIVTGATEGFPSADRTWITSDLDPYWANCDYLGDARNPGLYTAIRNDVRIFDHIITNPPFDHAEEIVAEAVNQTQTGICAMYLRLSFLEPKRTGGHATWLREHPPSCVLPLPRFAHRRNPKGAWGNDSVTCGWFVWQGQGHAAHLQPPPLPAWIFPSPDLFLAIHLETQQYRARVDDLTHWTKGAA